MTTNRNLGPQEALRKAYQRAGLIAAIEVYKGAMHGFCALDSQAYHEIQAEKAGGDYFICSIAT